MNPTPLFITLDELADLHQPWDRLVGRKTASLAGLLAQGISVPAGACVTTRALTEFLDLNNLTALVEDLLQAVRTSGAWHHQAAALRRAVRAGTVDPALSAAIGALLADHPSVRFAVRSSGTREDSGDASFAGLHDTVLDLSGCQAIVQALKTCWSSLYSDRAIRYFIDRGIEPRSSSMAVLIQVMVDADKSGVAFSVNPMSGEDTEVLIEAVAGLGEAVVAGTVTPDSYRYDWYRERATEPDICSERPVLEQTEVRSVADMAARLQALAGRPVDVEWAIRRSHLYVLQCRPVTTCRVDNVTGEWTTADFKDGGVSSTVCTPFMWSLYDRVWEATLPVYLRRVGLLARDTSVAWARMFFARPYWNVGAVKEALKRVPGFVERDFDDDLGIAVTYEGSGSRSPTTLRTILRGLLVLWQLRRSFKRQLLYCHRFVPTQRRRLDELDGLDVRGWSDERLFTFYRGFIDREYFRSEASYFHLIYDTSNANTLFHQQLQKLQTGVPLTDLIGGLTNLSHLRESRSLMVLVGAIRRNRLWNDYWTRTSVADIAAAWKDGREDHGMSLIRGHIDAFKHHATRQLDLQVPRYADDPTPVFSAIKQVLVSEIDHDPEEHALRRQHTADCARRSLLGALPRHQRRRLGRRLTQLRTFLWMREELRDLSTHYYYHVRRFTLAVAHRLIARGLLKRSGDVFFLPIREILSATEGLRTVTQLADTVAKRRRYYDGFRHFDNPNEIGRRYGDVPASTVDAGALRGIGCSPGVVDARVKIIRDITETERLEEGDILVTEFTDPGWTVTFGLLSAVVTETGGTLSHAAVIAREYGIPAVLAVPQATTRLRDGQLVRVDGSAGTITVPDDAPGDTLADDGHDVPTMRSAELVT